MARHKLKIGIQNFADFKVDKLIHIVMNFAEFLINS